MSQPIDLLRDDFADNSIAACWSSAVVGSATVAEVSGQAVLTLPSSTAGSHSARYTSTGLYDITGSGFVWNIGTMVATGVAASAFCQLITSDSTQQLFWRQLSNAITARQIVAGVETQQYTATWSASTYKYLRIRESGGTIFWDSSTNGTSWTNRASVANPFAVTALYVQMAVSCGNVASPGSLKLDDVNLVLPAPSSTWRETTADWQITNRLRPVTLAASSNAQGVLVTADTMDETTRALGGTLHYFAGPLGSSSGGFLQLTEYASLVLAQASAFPIPIDGRVDLPIMVDARYCRLYHRSSDASSHTLREFVPRRIVQADDIEAESIKAINIAAGVITADKIYAAFTITGKNIQTATTGARVVLSGDTNGGLIGYNDTDTYDTVAGTGTYQILWSKLDGKFYAGSGAVYLDTAGITIIPDPTSYNVNKAYAFRTASGGYLGGVSGYGSSSQPVAVKVEADGTGSSTPFAEVLVSAKGSSPQQTLTRLEATRGATTYSIELDIGVNNAIGLNGAPVNITQGLNVGSTTGAGTGDVNGSGLITMAGTGTHIVQGDFRIQNSASTARYLRLYNANGSNETIMRDNGGAGVASLQIRPGGTTNLTVEASKLGFLGTAAITRPTVTGSRSANAALASLLTALANYGLIVDSST